MSAINSLPSSGTSGDKRAYEPSMEEILASIRRIIADDQSIPGRSIEPGSTVEASQGLLRMPVAPDPTVSTQGDDLPAPPPAVYHEPTASEAPQPSREVPAPVMTEAVSTPLLPYGLRAHGPVSAPQYPTPDGRTETGEARVATAPSAAQPLPDLGGRAAPVPTKGEAEEPISRAAPALDDAELFERPIEPRAAPEPASLFSAATDSSVTSAFNMLAASRLADNSDELLNLVREMIRPMLRAWLDDNLPSMVERLVRAEIERVARGGR